MNITKINFNKFRNINKESFLRKEKYQNRYFYSFMLVISFGMIGTFIGGQYISTNAAMQVFNDTTVRPFTLKYVIVSSDSECKRGGQCVIAKNDAITIGWDNLSGVEDLDSSSTANFHSCWNNCNTALSSDNWSPVLAVLQGSDAYRSRVSDLSPNTIYHFRIVYGTREYQATVRTTGGTPAASSSTSSCRYSTPSGCTDFNGYLNYVLRNNSQTNNNNNTNNNNTNNNNNNNQTQGSGSGSSGCRYSTPSGCTDFYGYLSYTLGRDNRAGTTTNNTTATNNNTTNNNNNNNTNNNQTQEESSYVPPPSGSTSQVFNDTTVRLSTSEYVIVSSDSECKRGGQCVIAKNDAITIGWDNLSGVEDLDRSYTANFHSCLSNCNTSLSSDNWSPVLSVLQGSDAYISRVSDLSPNTIYNFRIVYGTREYQATVRTTGGTPTSSSGEQTQEGVRCYGWNKVPSENTQNQCVNNSSQNYTVKKYECVSGVRVSVGGEAKCQIGTGEYADVGFRGVLTNSDDSKLAVVCGDTNPDPIHNSPTYGPTPQQGYSIGSKINHHSINTCGTTTSTTSTTRNASDYSYPEAVTATLSSITIDWSKVPAYKEFLDNGGVRYDSAYCKLITNLTCERGWNFRNISSTTYVGEYNNLSPNREYLFAIHMTGNDWAHVVASTTDSGGTGGSSSSGGNNNAITATNNSITIDWTKYDIYSRYNLTHPYYCSTGTNCVRGGSAGWQYISHGRGTVEGPITQSGLSPGTEYTFAIMQISTNEFTYVDVSTSGSSSSGGGGSSSSGNNQNAVEVTGGSVTIDWEQVPGYNEISREYSQGWYPMYCSTGTNCPRGNSYAGWRLVSDRVQHITTQTGLDYNKEYDFRIKRSKPSGGGIWSDWVYKTVRTA